MENTISDAKVHFIAGKGGVGKTLISKALAKSFAKTKPTLLVELSEEESSLEKTLPEILEVETNLFYVKIFPDQVLYEYLNLKIPSKKILDIFLRKNLIQALCSAMPGLSDLTRLGKIWFHADEKGLYAKNIFQKVVVDLPSSGFVGRFLSIASVVRKAVKLGPLAHETQAMETYFKNPKNARLHLVATLEELIVNETMELFKEVEKSTYSTLGVLFVNRLSSMNLKDIIAIEKESLSSPLEVAEFIELIKYKIEEEMAQEKKLESITLPKIFIHEVHNKSCEKNMINTVMREIK